MFGALGFWRQNRPKKDNCRAVSEGGKPKGSSIHFGEVGAHSLHPPTSAMNNLGATSGIGLGAGWVGVSRALQLIVGVAVAGIVFPVFEAREEATVLAPEHFTA